MEELIYDVYVAEIFRFSTRSRSEAFDYCYTLTKFGFNADFKERTASNRDASADDSEGGCRVK